MGSQGCHCYTANVFFWVKTVAVYVATVIFVCLISLAVSLCLVRVWIGPFRPDEDSPALGMLLILLFVGFSSLFVPTCLGLVAELVQDRVLARRFSWLRGLLRSLLALPMAIGPVYAWRVLALREDARPTHSLANLVLLICVSAVFAYLSLRIKRQRLTQPSGVVGRLRQDGQFVGVDRFRQ